MLLILGVIIGLALGYLFHPQLEKLLINTVRHIKNKSAEAERNRPEDRG
jgi:hypothetical protein